MSAFGGHGEVKLGSKALGRTQNVSPLGSIHEEMDPSRVKKRGTRTKISASNRFIGCRLESRERGFGRTFGSNKLLTAAICKRSCEFGVVIHGDTGPAIQIDFDAPL